MTTAHELDGLDLHALDAFLSDEVAGYQGDLRATLIAGGRSNLTYRLTDGTSTWVLRRPPQGMLTPSAHDMGREYRVVRGLHGSAIPVARPVLLAGPEVIGVPFALVEFVPGAVLRSEQDLDPLDDDEVRACAFALVDTLADLHAVDPEEVGLGDLGRPATYVPRQVDRWHAQWRRVRTRDLPDVEALHAGLTERCPAPGRAAVVHGDFRIDNALLDPDDHRRVRAIVDWEMATLGDPLADLGLHLAYGDQAFAPVLGSAASTSPRMPARDELAERYASSSGHDLDGLNFHLALGYFKAAVIAEGIHERYLRGDTRGDGFDQVGLAVAPLAAAGRTALGGLR